MSSFHVNEKKHSDSTDEGTHDEIDFIVNPLSEKNELEQTPRVDAFASVRERIGLLIPQDIGEYMKDISSAFNRKNSNESLNSTIPQKIFFFVFHMLIV